MSPAIEVTNLSKEYKIGRDERFFALKDINFTIDKGDKVALIGPNGAGKSTLLKVLSRITLPTKGSIKIGGRICSLLELGAGFHPDLSGKDNIFLNGAILGLKKQEILKELDSIISFSEIAPFLNTPIKRYSSGMIAKLGFSIAVHANPDILIVDEALSVGDISFQKKCIDKLLSMGHEGKTLIFVGHQSTLLRALCTKAIYLDKGKLIKSGTFEECLEAYCK